MRHLARNPHRVAEFQRHVVLQFDCQDRPGGEASSKYDRKRVFWGQAWGISPTEAPPASPIERRGHR
jgi:hypothetical protein